MHLVVKVQLRADSRLTVHVKCDVKSQGQGQGYSDQSHIQNQYCGRLRLQNISICVGNLKQLDQAVVYNKEVNL